jgi:hypothetical protein
MSALPPKADIDDAMSNVRFVPKADIEFALINSETSAGILDFLVISDIPHARRVGAALQQGTQRNNWALVRLIWKECY